MLEIFISAGEASGDLYGSLILAELRSMMPQDKIMAWGIGGPRLKAERLELVQDSSHLGVIGVVDLIKNLFFFRELERRLIAELERRRPAVALLVDYPGLNLRLAKALKAKIPECKVVFFVAPQVWAWHKSRLYQLPALLDRLLVILPFEEDLHREVGTSTAFVGNPSAWFLSQVASFERGDYLSTLGLDPARPVVGIFPGSRKREISLMLPILLESAHLLQARFPKVQFILVKAETIEQSELDKYLHTAHIRENQIKLVGSRENHRVLKSIDLAWLTSGTVTLEAACAGTPLILGYLENPVFFQIFRWLRLTPHIGLPNIIVGEEICPELVQEKCTPENWAIYTENWLRDPGLLAMQKERIIRSLASLLKDPPNPFQRAAQEILKITQVLF